MRLDRSPDWDEVAGIVEDAYRTVAIKRLLTQLDGRAAQGRGRTATGMGAVCS